MSQERSLGLLLKPDEHVVHIVSEPRLGLTFTQFLATVSGTVKCLGLYYNIFYPFFDDSVKRFTLR